jgi:hypothetical protein
MAATIELRLDEERRFIRQRIAGDLDAADFKRLEDETGRLAQQVRDPDKVLILFDASEAGKGNMQARRAMVRELRRPTLRRMAVVKPTAIGRVMIRFILTVSGLDKIRVFEDEKQAIEWLLS